MLWNEYSNVLIEGREMFDGYKDEIVIVSITSLSLIRITHIEKEFHTSKWGNEPIKFF